MDIEIAIQNFFQASELKEILKKFYETDKNVQELWIDKIVEHIKKCIVYDIEIKKLIDICEDIKFKYNDEDVTAYVNIVNLHNYEDTDEQIKGIHLDNIGILTFEQLEKRLSKSSIYIPKRKSKFEENIKEINFDYLYSIYDYEYLEKRRLSNVNDNESKKTKLISRSSLHNDKIALLQNAKQKLVEARYLPFRYISNEYKRTNNGSKINRVFYAPICCSNVISFLLFYNKPFKFVNDLYNDDGAFKRSADQVRSQKKASETPVRSMLSNISQFINDNNLDNYHYLDKNGNKIYLINDDNFKEALYVDRLLFLKKIDYIFNFMLFSCCFDDFELYSSQIDSDFAYEYLMKKSSISEKKFGSHNFNNLFVTKFYILYLLKNLPTYSISAFISLMESIDSYFENLSRFNLPSDKIALVKDLYNLKDIFGDNSDFLNILMPKSISNNPNVKIKLLNTLSYLITEKVCPVKRFNPNDFINKFNF
ncbi:hypothetical protein [Holdemanella biformis]|uniref:hypothetical protein n=1 Tax=Holdemanella biformis TaxID=1735 RepID=UPI00248FE512|nr:hypothetical protein [Holdemanella biformis]